MTSPVGPATAPPARVRPLRAGLAINPYGFLHQGALGLPLLWRGPTPYIISNDHVTVMSFARYPDGSGVAPRQIYQPPVPGEDPARKWDLIAEAAQPGDYIPINPNGSNELDAAVHQLRTEASYAEFDGGAYSPELAEPMVGMKLRLNNWQDRGLSTTVTQLDATLQVGGYGPLPTTFSGQVVCQPGITRPGSSGSVLFTEEGKPCALVFAGSDSLTVATPLSTVFARLNVTLMPPGQRVEDYFADAEAVYWYDRRRYWIFAPGTPLREPIPLLQGHGYWVSAREPKLVTRPDGVVIRLAKGWNLTGW